MTDFYSQNRCVALRDLMGHCYVYFTFLFTLTTNITAMCALGMVTEFTFQ